MLVVALIVAGIVAGETPTSPPSPPPSPTEKSDRVHDYMKRCQDADGLTVITLNDAEDAVKLSCVTPALRRIPIDTTVDK